MAGQGGSQDDGYAAWLQGNNLQESEDYDMRAAYAAGVQPDENGHMPDTYKLPNHITFSSDSRYASQKGAPPAGQWKEGPEGWVFYASPTNIDNAGGVDRLQEYFQRNEPGVALVLPGPPTAPKADTPVVIDHGNPAKRERLI